MSRARTPGISRIDQPEKRTHGFFVRLSRKGKRHSGFFADKTHGGRSHALQAAQKFYRELQKKYKASTRREWLQIRRRKGRSPYIGVQRIVVTHVYWRATWSPRTGVVKRRQFSVRKHGAARARALAWGARREALASLGDTPMTRSTTQRRRKTKKSPGRKR
jgi:hypothetical protein